MYFNVFWMNGCLVILESASQSCKSLEGNVILKFNLKAAHLLIVDLFINIANMKPSKTVICFNKKNVIKDALVHSLVDNSNGRIAISI